MKYASTYFTHTRKCLIISDSYNKNKQFAIILMQGYCYKNVILSNFHQFYSMSRETVEKILVCVKKTSKAKLCLRVSFYRRYDSK